MRAETSSQSIALFNLGSSVSIDLGDYKVNFTKQTNIQIMKNDTVCMCVCVRACTCTHHVVTPCLASTGSRSDRGRYHTKDGGTHHRTARTNDRHKAWDFHPSGAKIQTGSRGWTEGK